MIKTIIYAHIDKENLLEKGQEIGLSEGALAMFLQFTEVKLEIDVDESGLVHEVRIPEQ